MKKIDAKLENFSKALKRLGDANTNFKSHKDEFSRDALIQRFEFTYELAWKTLYEVLTEQGVEDIIKTPKMVFTAGVEAGLINSAELWLNIILSRNKTSHLYDEDESITIADDISNIYIKEFRNLFDKLNKLK